MVLKEKRNYAVHRAIELEAMIPIPVSLSKMVHEVILTRREMNHLKRNRFR